MLTYQKRTETYRGISLSYGLYEPSEAGKLLPLVVALNDGADRQVETTFCAENVQAAHPACVLVPECPQGYVWSDAELCKALQELIFAVRAEKGMDLCRTYVVGAGRGAIGAWAMLGGYPRLIAGTVAIGGCGDPYHARNAKYAPVWAFHSRKDQAIDVAHESTVDGKVYLAGSRRLVNALSTIGGTLVRYTESDLSPEELAAKTLANPEVIDWLFAQDRMKVAWVEFVRPGVWRIDDYFMASCYLVEGRDRALMIDTGMAETDLMAIARSLTRLPISLAVTHPHLDHMMHAYTFDEVYMHPEEIERIPEYCHALKNINREAKMFPQLARIRWPEAFDALPQAKPIEDGDVIELGGDLRVEAVDVGGHTQHDLVYIDHGHRCVFTGDAIGSGYIVGVGYQAGQFRETYEGYRARLIRLRERLRGCEDYTFFGGHFIQENSCGDDWQEDYQNGQSRYFIPLSCEVVDDMILLCDDILSKDPATFVPADGSEFIVSHGSARLSGRRK